MPAVDSVEDRSALIAYLRAHPEAFQLNIQFLESRPRISAGQTQTQRMINLRPLQNTQVIIAPYHKKISRVLS